MANTLKTLSDGDITRKALAILHNKLVFCKRINRQYANAVPVRNYRVINSVNSVEL